MLKRNEKALNRLHDLDLLEDYQKGVLTINRLAFVLGLRLSNMEKKLYNHGYPHQIILPTLVDEEWLPVILNLKKKNSRLHKKHCPKSRKTKTPDMSGLGPRPRNKILLNNWEKRRQEILEKSINKKAKIISIPMGGKVR